MMEAHLLCDDKNFAPGVNNTANKGQFYKTKLCPNMILTNSCRRKFSCSYAHSEMEIRHLPDLTKTRLCQFMQPDQSSCGNPDCQYAHDKSELRHTDNLYKTKYCYLWKKGKCLAGNLCRHAHNLKELNYFRNQASASANQNSLNYKNYLQKVENISDASCGSLDCAEIFDHEEGELKTIKGISKIGSPRESICKSPSTSDTDYYSQDKDRDNTKEKERLSNGIIEAFSKISYESSHCEEKECTDNVYNQIREYRPTFDFISDDSMIEKTISYPENLFFANEGLKEIHMVSKQFDSDKGQNYMNPSKLELHTKDIDSPDTYQVKRRVSFAAHHNSNDRTSNQWENKSQELLYILSKGMFELTSRVKALQREFEKIKSDITYTKDILERITFTDIEKPVRKSWDNGINIKKKSKFSDDVENTNIYSASSSNFEDLLFDHLEPALQPSMAMRHSVGTHSMTYQKAHSATRRYPAYSLSDNLFDVPLPDTSSILGLL